MVSTKMDDHLDMHLDFFQFGCDKLILAEFFCLWWVSKKNPNSEAGGIRVRLMKSVEGKLLIFHVFPWPSYSLIFHPFRIRLGNIYHFHYEGLANFMRHKFFFYLKDNSWKCHTVVIFMCCTVNIKIKWMDEIIKVHKWKPWKILLPSLQHNWIYESTWIISWVHAVDVSGSLLTFFYV